MYRLLNYLRNKIWTIAIRFKWTGYKTMKITITRLDINDHGIFGHLTLDGSPYNCVTLENVDMSIKEGTYKVTLDHSPRLGYVTPHLAVPDRDAKAGGDAGIRIHPANWSSQLRGCIAVGVERDGWAIDSSKEAFNDLMVQLKGCDDITLVLK